MKRLLMADGSWPLYLPLIREALRTEWTIGTPDGDPEWLAREIGSADALVATRLPGELRGAATRLKALLYPGAGVVHEDPMDLPEGCVMCNVFEHEVPIAEFVMMAILMHATGVRRVEADLRRGRWTGSARGAGEPHGEAMGKTVGLVGYGHIGREVQRRAAAFGMTVLHVNSRSGQGDLERLLEASHFVVIACPLTSRTRGMIGEAEIAHMRRDACLINVARAEIVEERVLFEALRDGRVAGAALDVWYKYPPRAGDISHGSDYPFHELENVLATPHFSAWTGPMLERRARLMAENLDRLARGEALERMVLAGAWREGTG